MDTQVRVSSERGIALIVVLLLMAVLSGLATGFALNGHVEAQMSSNEMYFAGARAAAEAGLNRAIVEVIADTSHNLLSGEDGAVDATTPTAAVNNDNGNIAFLIGSAGPYALGSSGQYSYTIEILDDDNDALYETPLTQAQRTQMGEDGSVYTNANDRLILRATGYGPKGTTVKIARILETVDSINMTTTTTTVLSNPAILVNGNLSISGNPSILGTQGSVHANGTLGLSGNPTVSKDATSTGTFTSSGNPSWGGQHGGGRPSINVPEIHASDYLSIADYKLASNGQIQRLSGGNWVLCSLSACTSSGWTYSSGTWSLSGNSTSAGTWYAEGAVSISGNHSGASNTNLAFSVIATGSINISGNQKFTPENSQKIQFVTDKDFTMSGNQDLDDTTTLEGQIMVREQVSFSGNTEFQGRVIVQNAPTTGGLSSNTISGNPTFTYNGTLGVISTTTVVSTTGDTTYVNNVSGWMEQ